MRLCILLAMGAVAVVFLGMTFFGGLFAGVPHGPFANKFEEAPKVEDFVPAQHIVLEKYVQSPVSGSRIGNDVGIVKAWNDGDSRVREYRVEVLRNPLGQLTLSPGDLVRLKRVSYENEVDAFYGEYLLASYIIAEPVQ